MSSKRQGVYQSLKLHNAKLRKSWVVWTAQNIVLPSIPEVDASWLHIWSLSPHASKSEVILVKQGHFHQKILRPSTDWQSQCRWNDGGFYQSLELNNAILRESWGGVDRTEYCSAVHTGRWCKLTSYLNSKPTRKRIEVVLLEQGHFHQKILRSIKVWQSQNRQNDEGFINPWNEIMPY